MYRSTTTTTSLSKSTLPAHLRRTGGRSTTLQADAEFLRQQQESAVVLVAGSTSSAAAAEQQLSLLAKNNLLQLQVQQLLLASSSSSTSTSSLKQQAQPSWQKHAELYHTALVDVLERMEVPLPVATLPGKKATPTPHHPTQQNKQNQQHSHSTARLRVIATRNYVLPSSPVSASFSSHPHHPSTALPAASSAAAKTKPIGILPLTVLLPSQHCWDPHDYRKNRYFDKRNAMIQAIALYLQQECGGDDKRDSTRSSSSSVLHATTILLHHYRADPRKLCILLYPATTHNRKTPTKKAKLVATVASHSSTPNLHMSGCRFCIRLQFAMDHIDWIPPLRLVPNRNNWGTAATNTATSKGKNAPTDEQDASAPSTMVSTGSMHYNHCLTEDALHVLEQHTADSHEDPGDNSNTTAVYQDAALLLHVWCWQRGLWHCHDGLDEHTIQVFLLYLIRTKRVNARMTALQIVSACFKLWADTVWIVPRTDSSPTIPATTNDSSNTRNNNNKIIEANRKSVLVMPLWTGQTLAQTVASSSLATLYATTTKEQISASSSKAKGNHTSAASSPPLSLLELYRIAAEETPVLLDSSLSHNHLFRISSSRMHAVVLHAQASLQCWHTSSNSVGIVVKPFAQLFATEARFWSRHDAYMRIPLSDIQAAARRWGKSSTTPTWDANHSFCHGTDLGDYEFIVRRLVRILSRALGDRIVDIQCLSTGNDDDVCTDVMTNNSATNVLLNETPVWYPDQNISTTGFNSPTGSRYITLGINVSSDTCFRVVDRGPPPEHVVALDEFLELWGPKAELRRFKDGAIVHAVVWESSSSPTSSSSRQEGSKLSYIQYQNDDSWQGGIVERIIRHILQHHFLKKEAEIPSFALRDIISTVDGMTPPPSSAPITDTTSSFRLLTNPLAAHRTVMKAMDALADWLRKKSALTVPVPGSLTDFQSLLGIPLAIDAVEALSPALRYATLYPPVPHALLGAQSSEVQQQPKLSGAVLSDPIEIQIRFGASSKWPNDLKAIGAAKTAMLIQLVKGIERLKRKDKDNCEGFEGTMVVTPSYADVPFLGYVFRVFVRADPELKFLQAIHNPSPDVVATLHALKQKTVVAAMHHALVHGVYTSHPSSSATLRLAKRWISTHLLTDHIPFEALELMVVFMYTNQSSPMLPPGTAMAGFMQWLRLLSTHDWVRQPLLVDPQGHFNDNDYNTCQSQLERARGDKYLKGPAMYIVSPCHHGSSSSVDQARDKEKVLRPSFTADFPERVALSRAVALASRTFAYLRKEAIMTFRSDAWPGAFHESAESFRSFSALLRVDPAFIQNVDASSNASFQRLLVSPEKKLNGALCTTYTRSMQSLTEGPKVLQRKVYRNLLNDDDDAHDTLLEWTPIQATVKALRVKLGRYLILFYNDLCPDILAIVWRPHVLEARSFSALTSEYSRPVSEEWQSDTMVAMNVNDLLNELSNIACDISVDIKVFHQGPSIERRQRQIVASVGKKRKKDVASNQNENNSHHDQDSSDEESH